MARWRHFAALINTRGSTNEWKNTNWACRLAKNLPPHCDVVTDEIKMKKIFCSRISAWFFHIWYHIELTISKLSKYWGPGELFRQRWHRKLSIVSGKPRAFPIVWAFDQCSISNINGGLKIWPIFKADYHYCYFWHCLHQFWLTS